MFFIQFILLVLLYCPLADQNLAKISLRPKPKARAGGANKKAAPIFSFSFVSEVYIGSNSDLYTLSIGVLLDDIWIMSPNCSDCKISTTQYNYSSFYSQSLNVNKTFNHSALNLDIAGTVYSDSVGLLEYAAIDSQVIVCNKFVDVYNMAIDGILGLGSNQNSIVYKMYKENLIDKPIYSISSLTTPYLNLGTPNFLSLHLAVFSQQSISFSSKLEITEFHFDTLAFTETIPVEINSFSSYITGPFKYLAEVFKKLTNLGCHFEEELLMCECKTKKYPEFKLFIQGQKFTITCSEYLIQLGDNCFVGFKSGHSWILGEPFLKAYFLEFNLENQQLTAYNVSSLGNELPSPFETTEGWAIMIMLAVSLVGLYVLAFLIFLGYESYKLRQVAKKLSETVSKQNKIL